MNDFEKELDEQKLNEDSNLTDWKNEPTVRGLKQDFQDASSSRDDHITKVNTWLDNLNIKGTAVVKKRTGRSTVVPKLIRKQAEWRYAALSEPFLGTDDVFNVDPVTYEDKASAVQNALVLNNQFNTKIKKNKFIDQLIRTGVDEGTIIVRVGWKFEEREEEVEIPKMGKIPVTEPSLAQTLQAQGLPAEAEIQIGVKLEKQMITKANHPTVDLCDYRNITIDPSCEGDLDKAKFIIYSYQTSLSELKKDTRNKNLDKIVVDDNAPATADSEHSTEDNSSFNFTDKPRKLLIAYEYWGFRDIDNSGTLTPIVATYVGDVLIRMEKNPYPDQKLPFVIIQYLPVRRSIYGEPDGALLEDNQKIVGAVTRGMLDIMGRSANGQQGYRKDSLDITNKMRYEKGLDYEFNPQVNATDAFYMHKYPEIPNSAVTMLNIQHSEAESMSGVKAFTNGISGDALGSSVGGIRSALDATSKRELGILRRLAEGITEIGRKIISMNAEFLEEEEVVRITNEEFVTIRRDDLAGNFDLKLTISTPEADAEKASGLEFMLQTTGNNIPLEVSNMILSEIATLRKMPTLAKQLKDYKPQPDPMQVKKAELEIALLEAQVFNEQMKGRENEVDVGLKDAKTDTERAKARNLNSTSDKTDLDYLEQESGVPRQHEENMKNLDQRNTLENKAADSLLANKAQDKSFTSLPALG